MLRSPEGRYDVASAIGQGAREYQEDALIADFPLGMDSGIAVLADGMGGHAAGDVASKIVVTEVYSELKFVSENFLHFENEIPGYLKSSVEGANAVLREHVMENPDTQGMGATLVSLIVVENRIYWMSIGDSPLYLYREGVLRQLNEDHSMAPQIDFMAEQGLIDADVARDHPDRNCLTSVIAGDKVAKSDCPDTPFELLMDDILVVSSDGLQYLENAAIQKILKRRRRASSAEIAGYLMKAVDDLGDPDQDNISFTVLKLNHARPAAKKTSPAAIAAAGAAGQSATADEDDNFEDAQEPEMANAENSEVVEILPQKDAESTPATPEGSAEDSNSQLSEVTDEGAVAKLAKE